jgi:DNA-binding LacI/PurR family transcriptional regulator
MGQLGGMKRRSFISITEQVAEALLDGIRKGRWRDELPGRVALASELGVNHKTVESALKKLEQAGWLKRQGIGKGRRISQKGAPVAAALKVVILPYDKNDITQQELLTLLHRLRSAGHHASFAATSQQQLGMNAGRIARLVKKTKADAWIVVAGSSEVLEWFAARPVPAFALYGRSGDVRMASTGIDRSAAQQALVARLIELGHRRIVMLAHEERRKPGPGLPEREFLGQLEAHGIQTGEYNLPDWGSTPEDLHRGLGLLFRLTPPTALIIDETALFFATMQRLAEIGIRVPDQVSLACTNWDANFDWCRPTIAHIAWKAEPMIRRMIEWTENISRGKEDHRKTRSLAKFVDGGTIGPVPSQSARGNPEVTLPP